MTRRQPASQLIVEGKNDMHVIKALCQRHEVPETFAVVPVEQDTVAGGVDGLIASIPVRLKMAGLLQLGIVIDADQDVQSRWTAIRVRLEASGYRNVPVHPDSRGTILVQQSLPLFGVWLMPNNQFPGMLEDFVAFLVPPEDVLLPRANAVLNEIEQADLQRYPLIHHPKALIHTWLA